MRIGLGYDVHQLVEGRELIMGGVHIPYELGLLGHSDADVVCHAISDALLGAARLGDIGRLFPDTDDRWKNANSLIMLAEVAALVKGAGFTIEDVDCVIIAQQPKLSPYREDMRRHIAKAIGVNTENVGIKATTTEGLGFEGKGKGIAAQAVALLA